MKLFLQKISVKETKKETLKLQTFLNIIQKSKSISLCQRTRCIS